MCVEEFKRINQPRVEKILAMLKTIETSAKSNKAHEIDIAKLLEPISDELTRLVDPMAVDIINERTGPAEIPSAKGADMDTRAVPAFVNAIPAANLPAWSLHLTTRLVAMPIPEEKA